VRRAPNHTRCHSLPHATAAISSRRYLPLSPPPTAPRTTHLVPPAAAAPHLTRPPPSPMRVASGADGHCRQA
jgi:hypothetical protein